MSICMRNNTMHQPYFPRDLSPSKIPRPLGRDISNYKPTKLDLMKEDYRRKIMKEKEQKIIEMYENNQRKALERVSRYDRQAPNHQVRSVRNFFEQGRALGANGNMNAIQQHYNKYKKDTRRSSVPNMEKLKSSAGKDRGNLLVPIQNRKTDDNMVLTKPPRDRQKADFLANAIKSKSAPASGKIKSKYIDINDMNPVNNDNSASSSGSNSPPNSAHLQSLKRKNSINSREPLPGIPVESQEKLTDFQKWQLEQVRAKEERLQRHRNKNNLGMSERYDSDEGIVSDRDNQVVVEEEILRKQQELMSKIEEQQQELERIKREKDNQLEEERRELEKKQQRAIIEREKQVKAQKQKQKQKEEKEQREEERRRISEQQRKAKEEEMYRAEEENKHLTYRQDETHSSHHYSSPPPEQYKPHPPETRKPISKPKPRSYTPVEELEAVAGPNVDYYIKAAEELYDGSQSIRLAECQICGRSFAVDRLQKHENACKNTHKKRKVFDPVKMRIQGTEAAQFQSKPDKKSTVKKKNWRKQHEEFINSIRYAKKVGEIESKGGDIKQITPPPPTENPDYVSCPHCSRTFNSTAAERHIPRCKDIKGKPAVSRRR